MMIIANTVGFTVAGFVIGFAIGYFLRKVIMIGLFVIGGLFAFLMVLSYNKVIDVNWKVLDSDTQGAIVYITSQLQNMMVQLNTQINIGGIDLLAPAASGVGGLALGFSRR